MMQLFQRVALLGMATVTMLAHGAEPGRPVATCRSGLSIADARALAAATPNARAFQANLGAKLVTSIAKSHANGTVDVRVEAVAGSVPAQEVGVYTVNLHTGHVLDDDQEPAEDASTDQLRARLMAGHHCSE